MDTLVSSNQPTGNGEHENELLEDFFSPSKVASKGVHPWETLMRPEFHTFHKSRTFHKELSESLAMMDAIENVCPEILGDAQVL
eukprot:symbB.v1.2.039852.t1/scaffold6831.1/size15164/1